MTADVAVTINSEILSSEIPQPSTSTSNKKSKEKPPPEYCVLLVGTHHKQPLFEKLLSAADKFERHIQYQDTFYLYVNIQGEPAVVELNDPGIEHTGAREMAVRKAEAIILCYAAYNARSFHQLSSIAEDFKSRKNGSPPVLLICNEDEYIEDDEEDTTNAHSSTSEGYESSEEHEHSLPSPNHQKQRRRSMDKIRKSHEEICPITSEQGEDMAQLFGPDCEFLSLSFSRFQGGAQLMEKLITRIRSQAPEKDRSRPKERSQSILNIKRRRSIPHPLRFLQNHSGDDKSSPKKSPRAKKIDKHSTHPGNSSSSSRESLEKSDNSGFLGPIRSPPRRSKSVNVRGAETEEHETHFPSAEGGYRSTAKSKISKKGSGNRAEDSDLQSNSASSPTSLYQRHSPTYNSVHELGSKSNSPTTPTSLSVHRLVIGQENEEMSQEGQKSRENAEEDLTEKKSSDAGAKKKTWSFRKVGKGSKDKSAACVIS